MDWASELNHTHGSGLLFGIKGTGSYGSGLCHALQDAGCEVREVNRPNRQARRQRGKDDSIDAELAARALVAGTATAVAKTRNGEAEMLRILKGTRDSAVRCRTRAISQLKALVISAPAELRESLEHLATADLVLQFRLTETPDITCPATAASRALQALAARIHHLEQEIAGLGQELDRLTHLVAPDLRAAQGIDPDMPLPCSSRRVTILSACDRRLHLPLSVGQRQCQPVLATETVIA